MGLNGKTNTPMKQRRISNMMISGAGAGTMQDRGATQSSALWSLNPYYNTNFLERYREYVRWYNTSWEARKIIDIPVDDAFRQAIRYDGLDNKDCLILERAIEDFRVIRQLKRALKQERLFGGAVILGVFLQPEGTDLRERLRLKDIQQNDFLALNVIDVSRLSRPQLHFDPFSPDYDKIDWLEIAGVEVDATRLLIFDGEALISRGTQSVLQPLRYNPLGFSESKLATLYDLLVRAVGTQQGAYQLVNLASVLLIQCENLRMMKAVDSGAEAKLRQLAEQISIYRSAIIDQKGAQVTQHAANFGSVPELILTFTQLLSAASDIPATRFLGQAPGGLNATGDSDTRNYYDMIDSLRQSKIKPALRTIVNWIGISTFGYDAWKEKSISLDITFEPLWSLSETEQATVDTNYANILNTLYTSGIITAESVLAELDARGIPRSDLKLDIQIPDIPYSEDSALRPEEPRQEAEGDSDGGGGEASGITRPIVKEGEGINQLIVKEGEGINKPIIKNALAHPEQSHPE